MFFSHDKKSRDEPVLLQECHSVMGGTASSVLWDFPYGSNMAATTAAALGITSCIEYKKKGGRDETCRCSFMRKSKHLLRNPLIDFYLNLICQHCIGVHPGCKGDEERKWPGSDQRLETALAHLCLTHHPERSRPRPACWSREESKRHVEQSHPS